jgi:hypothetical protein
MKLNKSLILSVFILNILAGNVLAKDIKPFAPPMNIEGTAIESKQTAKEAQDLNNIEQQNNIETKNNNSTDLTENKNLQVATLEDKAAKETDNKTDTEKNIFQPDNQKNANHQEIMENPFRTGELSETTPVEDNPLAQEQLTPESQNVALSTPEKNEPVRHVLTDIQEQADEINLELRLEEPEVLNDLRVLWSAAVEKSTTIRLAIQKLSNPDEGQEDQSLMSKILSPLAGAAPIAAMATASPTQTAGALLGGGMLGTFASDVDKQYNKAFLQVSDFDLVMLAREVDELQAKLVSAYYEYRQAYERLVIAEEALKNARKFYYEAQDSDNFAASTASDAFYREAQQNHLNAKQNFLSARTNLEQMTGNQAIVYVEHMREKGYENLEDAEKDTDATLTESAVEKDPASDEHAPQ